jgi:hypothetical protein
LSSYNSLHASTPAKLIKLHDELCVRRAWPSDKKELRAVERELRHFGERRDTKRFRRALVGSGIAGTDLHHRFFYNQARWLARRWPVCLEVDWEQFENDEELLDMLPLLLPQAESLAVDSQDRTAQEWLDVLKSPSERDGAFLVDRFGQLAGSDRVREFLYEKLDPPLKLLAGAGTPSTTTAWHSRSPVVFGPPPERRPPMPATARERPLSVRRVAAREGRALLALARASMLVRLRDLDAFAFGDGNDVVMVDWPHGMQFAVMGMLPERRLLLESCFGVLVLQSGVPVGYGTLSALFNSVDIAYNIFPAFRGHGASWVMARLLGTAHHLFAATSASVAPYQLGQDNEEGIRSGAWWYYEKLGFRPDAVEARRLRATELRRIRRKRAHRSTPATLSRLAEHPMFFDLEGRRRDTLGRIDLGAVGDAASRELARRGSNRIAGLRLCVREVRTLLGPALGSLARWSPNERRALRDWAPLVLALPNVNRWSTANRAALAKVIRAKGSPHQADFVSRFDTHARLRSSILEIAS